MAAWFSGTDFSLICLVDSTHLANILDPEDLREFIRAYQATAAKVIERYDGHIAQYLGDGLLVYFGYPFAHEDDAIRAAHTALELPESMGELGDFAGIERENVNRYIRSWTHQGLLQVDQGVITLINREKLMMLAEI